MIDAHPSGAIRRPAAVMHALVAICGKIADNFPL
jgi:hypothetical protein